MSSRDVSKPLITDLLRKWKSGDQGAFDELVDIVYDELRRLARAQMRNEKREHTLQPTELVHEAFGRLAELQLDWQDRTHFLSMSARVMRRVLVDHARAKRAAKRSDGALKVTLDEHHAPSEASFELLALDEALERLHQDHERAARAVELHYFGGLTYVEIAASLGLSEATVDRDMRFARDWLQRTMNIE